MNPRNEVEGMIENAYSTSDLASRHACVTHLSLSFMIIDFFIAFPFEFADSLFLAILPTWMETSFCTMTTDSPPAPTVIAWENSPEFQHSPQQRRLATRREPR